MSFGKFLKEKRIKKNLTLRQMAYKTGFSHTYISDIEKEVAAKPETIEVIANVLELTDEEKDYVYKEIMYFKTPKSVLEELEALKTSARTKGNAQIISVNDEFIQIPVYGDISAGNGRVIYGDIVDYYALAKDTKNIDQLIAVRVSGDSMESRIPDRSQVLIRRGVEVENGDVGAFCINDECYVKQLKIYGGTPVLKSFNPSYQEIEIKTSDEFITIGKVVECKTKF